MPRVCHPFPKVTNEIERKTAGDMKDEFPRHPHLLQTHTSGGLRKCACVFVLACMCLHLCIFVCIYICKCVCVSVLGCVKSHG